jgi:hypothetical protein
MKYCPICDERYDEDIIRFCTKDGTPLIEEEEPKFTALPSETVDEPEEEKTVIRRNIPGVGGETATFEEPERSERIVIPTDEPRQQVRPRPTAAYYPPQQPPNTAKTVVLTILGTVFLLACGAGLFWLLQKESPSNTNVNLNTNLGSFNGNQNSNTGFDSNFNFNSATPSINTNINAIPGLNTNVNAKTPTPTRTPTPSPSPSPSPTATPRPSPSSSPKPSVSPTPRIGPRPTATGNIES